MLLFVEPVRENITVIKRAHAKGKKEKSKGYLVPTPGVCIFFYHTGQTYGGR